MRAGDAWDMRSELRRIRGRRRGLCGDAEARVISRSATSSFYNGLDAELGDVFAAPEGCCRDVNRSENPQPTPSLRRTPRPGGITPKPPAGTIKRILILPRPSAIFGGGKCGDCRAGQERSL
jgi:hypothetical protein